MPYDFERYHCQIALPGFGKEAQQHLQNARVLIVGAGGLGCPAAQYLAAAGIGTIGIADDDVVSLSNLHRQVLYTPQELNLSKVEVAVKKLQQQNPSIKIIPYNLHVTSFNVMELIAEFDLIIEGTDNFETKYLLNDACVLSGKPLIYGAIYQYEGQVSIWNVLQKDGTYSPNYRDVFPDAEHTAIPNCSEGGVIPTLAGIVGCMQANEALKYFAYSEELLAGKLWMINVLNCETRTIKLKKSNMRIEKLPETVSTITMDHLVEEIGNYELIDVRNADEHRLFNIGGKNIPLADIENRLSSINTAIPVVCYCATGKRSVSAAMLIKGRFPKASVYLLKNGIGERLMKLP